MCEIFGISAKQPININEYLEEFYSHSPQHPHGWGLAMIENNESNIEKEPLQATKSFYLKQRLKSSIITKSALAHIRYATIGNIAYKNCHPYTLKDNRGRRWTLVHNGTVFDYPILNQYIKEQKGDTDSERILYYIVDIMNEKENIRKLSDKKRFELLNEIFTKLSKGNKLNIIFTDGTITYVHTNYKNTLYYLEKEEGVLFSTAPLSQENWLNVPFTTLLAYKDGKLLFKGTDHHNEYFDKEANLKHLYQIFSDL